VAGEHNCLGGRTVCWQLNCSALFDTDMTF
jgi:hypothetical protein